MKSMQRWCTNCGTKLTTTHTRSAREGEMTWRRKQCMACGMKISTFEYTAAIYDEESTGNPGDDWKNPPTIPDMINGKAKRIKKEKLTPPVSQKGRGKR